MIGVVNVNHAHFMVILWYWLYWL